MSDMQAAAFQKAVLLAGELEEKQEKMLRFFCGNFVSALTARLREGLAEEQYGEAVASAAALLAAAAMLRMDTDVELQEFKAGDLTVKQAGGMETEAAVNSLEQQAQMLIAPFLQDRFCFSGV